MLNYFVGAVIVSAAIVLMNRFTHADRYKMVLLKCPGCESKCYDRVPGENKLGFLSMFLWQMFCWACLWRLHPSLFIAIPLIIAFLIPYSIAERRVYHWAWMRYHPSKCGGGGHPKLAPEGA